MQLEKGKTNMYLQEIVINPDIFEKISRAFSPGSDEDIDLKSYKENLKSKSILFDKIDDDSSLIYDKIIEILSKSSDSGKDRIDIILKSFLKSDKIRYLSISKSKKYCRDNLLNQILNLSLSSESRIINSEDKSALLFKFKHEELNYIEMLNFEEFIRPKSNSRIFSLEKDINISRGEKFSFEEYFKPYLNSVKNIKITDRYLRKREGGYLNLIRLLKVCDSLVNLEIQTILNDDSVKYKPDIKIEEIESEIKKLNPNIAVSFKSTGDHKRSLETEDFVITIDPGFDFVNRQYIAANHNVTITFKYKIKNQ